MALNAYAQLTANGTPLSGDVTLTAIGGVDVSADHIELYEVHWGARIEAEAQGGRRTSQRRMIPVRFMKPVDRATPDLYQALSQQATIAGEIKIFDTNPEDGATRHRFSVTLTGARLLSIESASPSTFQQAGADRPYEVIELAPHTITYTDVVNSKEYTDEWSTAV
jgi:type VI secretion system Hcp family effector